MHSSPNEIWARGNCRDVEDPDIFYPPRDRGIYPTVAAAARLYCHGGKQQRVCPVILECLLYGLITEDRFGIWGGLSPRERNALRRTRALDRYQPVQPLRGQPHYGLIEEYLRRYDNETDH